MIACSSSARNPIDRTRTVPDPMERSSGTIFPALASTSPSMPIRRGTEKPQMSASRIPTTRPREANATARLTVTDDLPTPPLPEAMARTRVEVAIAVSGASSRAFQRARAMTAARSSASMAATCTSTERTQSRDRTWFTTSRSIWLRNGTGGDGQCHVHDDGVVVDADAPDHAEVHDGVAQFGVHHRPQAVAHLLLASLRRGLPRWGRGGARRCHAHQLYLRGGEFRPVAGRVLDSARCR